MLVCLESVWDCFIDCSCLISDDEIKLDTMKYLNNICDRFLAETMSGAKFMDYMQMIVSNYTLFGKTAFHYYSTGNFDC